VKEAVQEQIEYHKDKTTELATNRTRTSEIYIEV
jgi:hypothetical protein